MDNHHIVSSYGFIIWGTEWEKLERETNHERPLTLGNTQRVEEGEVGRGTK